MLDSIRTRIVPCSNPIQLTDLRPNLIDEIPRKFARIALIRGILVIYLVTRKRRLRTNRTCCNKQFVTLYRYDIVTEEIKLNTRVCSSVFRNVVCICSAFLYKQNSNTSLLPSIKIETLLFFFFHRTTNVSIKKFKNYLKIIRFSSL